MLTSLALSQFYEIGLLTLTLNQDAPAVSQSRNAQMNAKWEQGGVTDQLRQWHSPSIADQHRL